MNNAKSLWLATAAAPFANGSVLAAEVTAATEVHCAVMNSCKGKNACQGHGWVSATKEQCEAKGGRVLQ